MRRVEWGRLDAAGRERALRRPCRAAPASFDAEVAAIVDAVAARGDAALGEFAERFDRFAGGDFSVDRSVLEAAKATLAGPLRLAIEEAAGRIEAFHRAGVPRPYAVQTAPGVVCERIQRPIRRVGLYIPAGSAPLPSTALMLALPAMLAGCPEVIACTPPGPDGEADPVVLAVLARVPGIRVFRLGGAHAIAAMAFGTESVPRCDKLFGPGNAWVDAAKRLVAQRSGGPAIDLAAGPSEVMVIADAGADPAFVAADLLSQAEHGPDSQAILVSNDAALLDAVQEQVDRQLPRLPRAAIATRSLESALLVLAADLDEAMDVGNAYAPEHLILALRNPRAWLPRVESAGSVFLGDWTPEALGDYCSGSNHVLPTGGAARASSGLSVGDFQVSITVQSATAEGLAAIGGCAATLAHAEGLDAHAHAVELRLESAR